ncbi:MAG: hypothetical protein AAF291_12330 [Pseudomonadota bacterium]
MRHAGAIIGALGLIASLALAATFSGSQRALAQDAEAASVELVISGPVIEAEETRSAFIYVRPEVPEAYRGNSASAGILAQGWSLLGREDLGAAAGSDEYAPRPNETPNVVATGIEATLDAIAKRASDARVVIINESHEVTLHRDFSRRVIERLRPLGFTVLAAETFNNQKDKPDPVEESAHLPYPRVQDGYYLLEPVFGEMVRTAKRLGYRLAAYEQVYDPDRTNPGPDEDWRQSIKDRETAQAQHLAQLLKSMAPHEKLIVHAGYGHANEEARIGKDGWDDAWMAARLKRDHGFDPLTIAQTKSRGSADTVQLFLPSDKLAKQFDLIVDHPIHGFRHGRSDWRFSDEARAVDIPQPYASAAEPLVIEAFAAGEPFEAVPVDRVWVEPGEDVKLALKPGRYIVRAVRPVLAPLSSPEPQTPATPE